MQPSLMEPYVALLRGLNVGGRNPIVMQDLAECFRDAGYEDVRTFSQSGNVLFMADPAARASLEGSLQRMLEERFETEILTIVRSRDEFAATVAAAPANHGSADLRSEVFFLKDPLTAPATFADLPALREGVDSVALGPGAIYFSRLTAKARQTRITRLMGMPVFQQMTVRSWRTTTRLLTMLGDGGA